MDPCSDIRWTFWPRNVCDLWSHQSGDTQRLATLCHNHRSDMVIDIKWSNVCKCLFYRTKTLTMDTISIVCIALLLYMTSFYILSIFIRRADIVDIGWGLGFIMVAWLIFSLNYSGNISAGIIPLCVTVWWIRLSSHIFQRNRGNPEDYRYAEWRRDWGKTFWIRSYFQIFLLQGLLLFLVSLPLIFTGSITSPYSSIFMVLGFVIWCIGFSFEIIWDAQLAAFKKNPDNKGKLLESGLWKYTRHPNYFWEVTLWWWIWVMSLAFAPHWWTIIWPCTISFLIYFVSGIPLLEKKLMKHPEFPQYSKRVSKFVPFFPKK